MVDIKIKTDKNNKGFIVVIWVLLCIVAKYIQIVILPAKYSADGRRIFLEAVSGYRSGDVAYDTAANFFSVANKIFHITSYEAWSVVLGFFGSIILLWFIKESLDKLYIGDFIFLSCSVFLMNVYILIVSKELIQVIILIPAVVILYKKCNTITKIISIISILVLIAFFLRRYFFLTALIFFMICKTFLRSLQKEKKGIIRKIFLILLIGILGMYLLNSIAPTVYEEIFKARYIINQNRIGHEDAQTMIINVLEDDGSIRNYFLNLLINLFRLMFPFSLITEGLSQILFLVYQIILSIKLVRFVLIELNKSKGEKIDENVLIAASLLIAYFIVAAIFEPDYGSVIRHEMAMFPIMYIALIRREDYVRET